MYPSKFLEYNDSIAPKLLDAVTQKELKEIQKQVINLEEIAQKLQIKKLSDSLELLKMPLHKKS